MQERFMPERPFGGISPVGPGLAGIGPIRQLAYVVPDLKSAMAFWSRNLGVGPFFHAPRSRQNDTLWRGQPVVEDFQLALSYWGEMQIELIQPNTSAPSFYQESLASGHKGLHHVCVYTDDMAQTRRRLDEAQAEIVFEGKLAEDGEVLYADPGGDCGFYYEVLKPPPFLVSLFARIKQDSEGWDGERAVRGFG